MRSEATGRLSNPRAPVADPDRRALAGPLSWVALIVLVVVADVTLADEAIRLDVLRGMLILTAVGEAMGGVSGVFRPRWFAERNGRAYDPAYHGVSQDFGFYNLSYALLLTVAALDPRRHRALIGVAILLYTVHGVTHVFRRFGLYYGGGTPISTRPQAFEMRDGLQLLAAATAMILFFP